MTIFNPAPFINSCFAQAITYYQHEGDTDGLSINAVVEFKTSKPFTFHKSEVQQKIHPITLLIAKSDLDAVVENKDTVSIHNNYKNRSQVVNIKEIMPESDSETWILGAT